MLARGRLGVCGPWSSERVAGCDLRLGVWAGG
jgi:hypothetical protein